MARVILILLKITCIPLSRDGEDVDVIISKEFEDESFVEVVDK